MTQLEQFTRTAVATPELKSMLKAAPTDDVFVDLLVEQAHQRGYEIDAASVRRQMQSDRSLAEGMSEDEFEDVAGTLLGARLSGGHQSGSNC